MAAHARIEDLGENMYRVFGSRPVPYVIDAAKSICSCPDWQRNHERVGPCKHLHGIALRIRRGSLRRHAPRTPIARVVKLEDGESLRGVLADPEALDAIAERLGVA